MRPGRKDPSGVVYEGSEKEGVRRGTLTETPPVQHLHRDFGSPRIAPEVPGHHAPKRADTSFRSGGYVRLAGLMCV